MSGNRKLGKPTDQRMAMMRAMVTYLLENGQIKTTVARAKEVAPMTEKMISLAKKLFDEIGPKYENRNGGYTRIVRIGPRRGDAAEMAFIELV